MSKREARAYFLMRCHPAHRACCCATSGPVLRTAQLAIPPARRCQRRAGVVSCRFRARLEPDAAHLERNWCQSRAATRCSSVAGRTGACRPCSACSATTPRSRRRRSICRLTSSARRQVAVRRHDPAEPPEGRRAVPQHLRRGIVPPGPLAYWGWGDIPDQYGRAAKTTARHRSRAIRSSPTSHSCGPEQALTRTAGLRESAFSEAQHSFKLLRESPGRIYTETTLCSSSVSMSSKNLRAFVHSSLAVPRGRARLAPSSCWSTSCRPGR